MSFDVRWDYPASKVLLEYLGWPESSNVAQTIHRFAARRAPELEAGEYQLIVPGFRITVRIAPKDRAVIVLYVHRWRKP